MSLYTASPSRRRVQMNNRKFVYTAASVASACIVLTSCVAGNAEENSPTTSPTASHQSPDSSSPPPSKTPEAKPEYEPATATSAAHNVPVPKIPSTAQKNTQDGATQFVAYYFELINYVAETNDTKEIRKYTSRGCKECGESIIDPAEYSKSVGEWMVGGAYKSTVIDTYKASKNTAIVTTVFESAPFKMYIAPNKVASEYDKLRPTTGTFQLEFDDGWTVTDFLVDEN